MNEWETKRFVRIQSALFQTLRTYYPEKFIASGSGSEEFAIAVGGGDYPQVRYNDLPCFQRCTMNDTDATKNDVNEYLLLLLLTLLDLVLLLIGHLYLPPRHAATVLQNVH